MLSRWSNIICYGEGGGEWVLPYACHNESSKSNTGTIFCPPAVGIVCLIRRVRKIVRGTPCEFSSEARFVVCVLFGRSEMTLRDARGVVMEKESREARQSARNNVIL